MTSLVLSILPTKDKVYIDTRIYTCIRKQYIPWIQYLVQVTTRFGIHQKTQDIKKFYSAKVMYECHLEVHKYCIKTITHTRQFFFNFF